MSGKVIPALNGRACSSLQAGFLILGLFLLLLQACVHRSMFNADRRYRHTALPGNRIAPLHRNSLEWWYVNAHLRDSSGREFAYHHAVFRRYTFPLQYVWMSSTAIGDLDRDTQYTHYRFYRNRGVRTAQTGETVWMLGPDFILQTAVQGKVVGDSVYAGVFSMESILKGGTGWVPHAPNAMLDLGGKRRAGYLSQPFLEMNGLLFMDSSRFQLSGTAWYDRQWNALKLTRYPWNWISLEHDSFRLMLFSMEEKRGGNTRIRGAITDRQGITRYLRESDIILSGSEVYTSTKTGKEYPLIWQFAIPELDLQVCLKARIRDCEMPLVAKGYNFMTYWEGPYTAWGLYRGQVFHSRAFVEMTRP